jgi:uncharacterized protein (UPF0216 family)
MRVRIIITIIIVLIIALGITHYLRSGGMRINADIPSEKTNLKGLIEVTRPYIEKYWGNRTYYVGEVSMELNENFEGKVEIWYKDEKKNRKGVPNIITVEYDTKQRKIIRIVNQVRDSKIVPGILNIDKWNIDSNEAFDIAKNTFDKLSDFEFTVAHIFVDKLYNDSKEKWSVNLYNENNKKAYHLEIDVYTGEIYRNEIK